MGVFMEIRAQGSGREGNQPDSSRGKLAGNSVTQRKAGEPSNSCGVLSPVLLLNSNVHYVGIGITWELFLNSDVLAPPQPNYVRASGVEAGPLGF